MKLWLLVAGIAVMIVLAIISLFIGVSDVSLRTLFAPDESERATQILLISRLPRTIAILLAGSSLAIAGLVMQIIVRNRFVEPSTTGTTESAALGFLAVLTFVHTGRDGATRVISFRRASREEREVYDEWLENECDDA